MKRSISVFLLLLINAAAPLLFAQISVENDTYKLDNGLNVILHVDKSTPIVAVNLWYHTGSKNEKPGRTGFAHLFEHMLFQGSANVGDDAHFKLIQGVGGSANGSTNPDRTNYWENAPSNYLELLLWLEADRMGWLLPAMDDVKLDNQRKVVKNERRQSYENRPYGLAWETLHANLYPPDYPYHWMTIGSMEDLSAASLEDVKGFFSSYYGPNNASLAIAGDFDPAQAKMWVSKYFGEIPSGPPVVQPDPPIPTLSEEVRITMEDKVQLPRLYMFWHTVPLYGEDDAALDVLSDVLSGGKNSRLFRSLIYDNPIAQDANAFQISREIAGSYMIQVTAKPDIGLSEIEAEVWKEIEKVQNDPPSQREVQRAVNGYEANFVFGIQRVGSFGGKADKLNGYYFRTGISDGFQADLDRYLRVTPEDVQRVAKKYLGRNNAVILSVVPEGKLELQASK